MKSLILAVLAVLAVFMTPSPVSAEDDPGFEALMGFPVMEGLHENLSQRVVFDKAEGRIIRTLLVGDIGAAEAAAFYREVLFQLGWAADTGAAGLTFTRDEEELTLSFSNTRPLELTISLNPLS